jgi:SAM-dependent methyltransferase
VGSTGDERFRSGENYTNIENLKARQSYYDYKTPNHDLQGIVSQHIGAGASLILDVGCGNGNYVRRLREDFPDAEVVAVDRSATMMEAIEEPTVVADVADLPFQTDVADAVLAMHMLYHVDDIQAALDELQRVLSPDGVMFVSTLAEDDKEEYAWLWREAALEALGVDVGDVRSVVLDRFSLETAQHLMEERFASVRLHDLPGVVDLPEAEPLLAAYRSTRSFSALGDADFDKVMGVMEDRLAEHFTGRDSLRITAHTGILECRRPYDAA